MITLQTFCKVSTNILKILTTILITLKSTEKNYLRIFNPFKGLNNKEPSERVAFFFALYFIFFSLLSGFLKASKHNIFSERDERPQKK